MSSRSRTPFSRAALVGYCLMLACMAVAVFCTATAHASLYRMVLCGANNGPNSFQTATNTASAQNPAGIFTFNNYCWSSQFPAGNDGYLRIAENQGSGTAGYSAFGSMSWTVPGWVDIAQGGGYTRMPNAFNDGWRGRFWLEGRDGSTNNVLMQGAGVQNGSCDGVCWATTSTFASHLWPFSGIGKYQRFVFEMTCFRQAGCDRTNFNAVDANSMVLTLSDAWDPRTVLDSANSALLSGNWVRGAQGFKWGVWEEGSGVRFERVRVDGATVSTIDHRAECNLDSNPGVGEFARDFRPCPTGVPQQNYVLDTAKLSDGSHTVGVCTQDYGQSAGISGTGGESCDQRQVRVDNSPPPAPAGLSIQTSNPARYVPHFGAQWTLPPDPGSPVTKVHYNIVDAAGNVVVPEKVLAATNPTKLADIAGPEIAGDYRLRVWLEDQVGLTGPVATVAIPHDTTPPAAPQEVSVTSPETSRAAQGFDVRWRNVTDQGSPIEALHYQVLDSGGNVVVATRNLEGDNPEQIGELETPRGRGDYSLRLWLSDAEGNVGAPAEAPLSYSCVRSDVAGGRSLASGIGEGGDRQAVLAQGTGTKVTGALTGPGGPVTGAALCIFSRVVTDGSREFLGLAMSGGGGSFAFPLAAGPSRELTAVYRDGQRQIEASSTALTQVAPTLKLRKQVVRNKHKAWFSGDIPGPHNDNVVVVLQVKSGKGWRVYRRYRTRSGGHFSVGYRFTQTGSPTTYTMRAQVRRTVGFPYEPGNSPTVRLRVMP
ncbi:MAG TPA: hypothetical protein VFN18_10890 [Solirubrobacterales bacterium]|nr:hypothetical protein [Solirubrobacterales bacterium]